jgi:DNA polymerase-3 subunit beta
LKLTLNKDRLNESIQHVSKAVSNRTTIPILSGIKLEASPSGVTLTASDTDISIQSFIPIQENEQTIVQLEHPGSVVVPGRLFTEIIRRMPSDQVEIGVDDHFRISIRSGSSELELVGMDPEEFPLLPKLEENNTFSVQSEVLKSMIRNTIFAVSTNESSPILTGILWTLNEQKFKFVATDRHRLSTCERIIEADPQHALHNIVISGANLSELQKLLPDQETMIDIVAADNQVLFKMGSILFFTRILDGTFPDTSKIIPKTFAAEIVVNAKQFTDAMERAYLLSREEKTKIVKLTSIGNNKIEIFSSLSEIGKITDQVDVLRMEGDPVKISFNSRYMLDALKSIDSENIHIGFTGPMSPFVIRPEDSEALLHLILPYRTAN